MNDFIEGDVRLTKKNYKQYFYTKRINGTLIVDSKSVYVLPSLEMVSDVIVLADCALQLPKCNYVENDITVKPRASLFIGGMGEKIGRVRVMQDASLRLDHITEIQELVVRDAERIDIPKLTTVTNNLLVEAGNLVLPECRQVGGNLTALRDCIIVLARCHSVNGSVTAYVGSDIRLPRCTTVGKLFSVFGGSIEVLSLTRENTLVEIGSAGKIIFSPTVAHPAKPIAINYQGMQSIFNAHSVAMF